MEWRREDYLVTDDKSRIDLDFVTRALNSTYWARDRSREAIRRSIQNSAAFVLLHQDRQVGFCRLVSDYVTFAYLADVYIEPTHRGRGLGKWLLACTLKHPAAHVEKIMLSTRDAHGLYARYGFEHKEAMIAPGTGSTPIPWLKKNS